MATSLFSVGQSLGYEPTERKEDEETAVGSKKPRHDQPQPPNKRKRKHTAAVRRLVLR